MATNAGKPSFRNAVRYQLSRLSLGTAISDIPWWNCYNHALWLRVPRPLLVTDITQILSEIEHGDPQAAEQLLALVYAELRRLAAQKLAHEKPGQTLHATGLVHEAYLRLFGDEGEQQHWDSRGHFFAAAAEAMRRILIENARRKKRRKAWRRPTAS